MNISQLNITLREIINQLISDGFGKKALSDMTVGQQSYPQFDRFVKGTDLGIKPLGRIIDGYGYNLLTIPIKKDDHESMKVINDLVKDFDKELVTDLKEFLENRPVKEKKVVKKKKEPSAINCAVDEIRDIIDNID